MNENLFVLKGLYEDLMEELTGAAHYSELACQNKTLNPDLAKRYDAMASDEQKHASIIETEIESMVKKAGSDSHEAIIHEFMKSAIQSAWTKAKSWQMKYKG